MLQALDSRASVPWGLWGVLRPALLSQLRGGAQGVAPGGGGSAVKSWAKKGEVGRGGAFQLLCVRAGLVLTITPLD